MQKKNIIVSAILLSVIAFKPLSASGAEGDEVLLTEKGDLPQKTITTTSKEPAILAPEGLQDKEKAQLERQYRYAYRHKAILEEPSVSTPFTEEEPSITPIDKEALTEEDKLYRYFGIATILAKTGRFDEAKIILEYLISKKPADQYLRKYLEKINAEIAAKDVKWLATSRKDAILLKRVKIKELMDDGNAYYRQGKYDLALLKFADVLSMEPDNAAARSYMEKLKKHYLKETQVESIIKEWEISIAEEEPAKGTEAQKTEFKEEIVEQISQAVEEALNEAELRKKGMAAGAKNAANAMLDNEEIGEAVLKKASLGSLMDDVETDLKINEIITLKKEEEKRKTSYTLGTGDTVRISVQDHPEISGSATIGPDGDILLPLVNEPIYARDITAPELQKRVAEALKRYVKDPVVYVGITDYRSKLFYVIDETGCTPYNITRANFTLRDALFISDWGSNRALGRVLVIKPHTLHPVVKKVDAFDIVYRGNLSKNIRIENGDVIYVPVTAANKISTTIADTLSPFKAVRDIRNEWLDWRWDLKNGWYNMFRIPRSNEEASSAFSSPGTSSISQ